MAGFIQRNGLTEVENSFPVIGSCFLAHSKQERDNNLGGVGGGMLIHFLASQTQNNHVETILITTLLCQLAHAYF